MARHLGRLMSIMLGAAIVGVGPAPAASGEPPAVCDVKASINGFPATDGPLDLYEPQWVIITGTGYPPSAPIEDLFTDYRGGAVIPLESQPDGTFVAWRGVLNPEYPYPQTITHEF